VGLLRRWKRDHDEKYGSLVDSNELRDEQLYAGYVDRWEIGVHINTWIVWTTNLLLEGGQSIEEKVLCEVQDTCIWLLERYWPNRDIRLEQAFSNFRLVWQDLQIVFLKHAIPFDKFLRTERFYKGYTKEPQRDRILREYKFHVALVEDLALELTRAANLICDRVRESLDANFRIHESALVTRSGYYDSFGQMIHRVEYRGAERDLLQPYPGLEQFMEQRSTRDYHFGEGVYPAYLIKKMEPAE
jgi:hypothetical protein